MPANKTRTLLPPAVILDVRFESVELTCTCGTTFDAYELAFIQCPQCGRKFRITWAKPVGTVTQTGPALF